MAVQVNEGATENGGVERQSGESMMEQLMPEITSHALSYLDYRSLCCLSMTNSHMRNAANDDYAWKALYRKVGWISLLKIFFLNFKWCFICFSICEWLLVV